MWHRNYSTPGGLLDQLTELLRRLLEQQQEDALVFLDKDGRVVAWLMGAERMFGYESGEMIGGSIERLFTPEDQERRIPETELVMAAKTGKGEEDRWLVRKDGVRIWVFGVVTCLRTTNGEILGFAKLLRDRTDIKGQLDRLRSQAEKSKADLEDKKLHLGAVAHELRNPIGVIGNAVTLLESAHPNDSRLTLPLQMLNRQVKYLSTLIEDMLEAARVAVGKVPLNLQPIDIRNVIESAVETCGAGLRQMNQAVELLLPPTPIIVDGDGTRLQQVFVNLCSNASKFSPASSRIQIKATTEDEQAVVRIRDEGRGISRDLIPHVFKLFAQETGTPGTLGIGLSIVKEYVELHGGTVSVRSEGVGAGSEFTVRLPLRRPRAVDKESEQGR